MDFTKLIDEMEEIIEGASGIPLTSKCVIDRESVWEVIQQIRLNYPEEMKQASWIKKERERILAEAQQEAQQIKDAAKAKVVSMVNETEIIRLAKEQADVIISTATQRGNQIVTDAKTEGAELKSKASLDIDKMTNDAYVYVAELLEMSAACAESTRSILRSISGEVSSKLSDMDNLCEKIAKNRQYINKQMDENK